MSKLRWLLFLCLIVLFPVIVFGQNEVNQPIPEGMEAIRIGGSGWLIVPKGAKTRKVGAQIIVEGTKEYMSRRFEEIDQRFEELEKKQQDQLKEIESLKNITGELDKKIGTIEDEARQQEEKN